MRNFKYFLLLIIPLAVGALLGYYSGLFLSGFNGTVRLDSEITVYNKGSADFEPPPLSIDADEFIKRTENSKEALKELSDSALKIKGKFGAGGLAMGLWFGLVFFLKTFAAARGRKFGIFEPDKALCVSCARCFNYCPVERERIKKIVNGRGKNQK